MCSLGCRFASSNKNAFQHRNQNRYFFVHAHHPRFHNVKNDAPTSSLTTPTDTRRLYRTRPDAPVTYKLSMLATACDIDDNACVKLKHAQQPFRQATRSNGLPLLHLRLPAVAFDYSTIALKVRTKAVLAVSATLDLALNIHTEVSPPRCPPRGRRDSRGAS